MPWVQAYLTFVRVEKRLAARSLQLYAQGLAQLRQWAGQQGLDLAQVQPTHIRRLVAQWHGQGRSRSSIALALSCWRSFYAWAVLQGHVASNPVLGIRPPRAPERLPKALSVDQAVHLAAFSDAQAPDSWQELRDAALTELLYSSGLRVGELVGLDVQASAQALGWVDGQEGLVHVTGKGSKRRSVPVGQAALQALQRWLQVRTAGLPAAVAQQAEAALFLGLRGKRLSASSVRQRLRQRAVRAGLAVPVHPHMLRHSCASHMLQSSGDLRGVQEMLGHASLASTQIYTRLDFQHLARVYDSAHPRAQKKR